MFTVNDKVALITGAARGIGFECAKALLRKNLKAVSLIDIDESNGQKALKEIECEFGKNRAMFVKADVANKIQLEEAFEITVKKFNQLDIVVNNAAILHEVEVERCISVNLLGTIYGSILAMETYLPKYKSTSEGVIINVSSRAGYIPFETIAVYTGTKHGIIGFSRSIGGPVHYKMYNVRVVTVCPGGTETDIHKPTNEQLKEPFLSLWYDYRENTLRQHPHHVAEHAVELIKKAPSGSVWDVSNNTCTEVTFNKY